jgi:DNA anti-recombination protein RmuC
LGSAIALFLTFAFGVGAILIGLQVNKASGRQVRALETRLAEANSETERIKANAAKLKRESDEKIAQLNSQTAGLSADAEKARESIAVANERTAKLESDTAAARLSTEELRKANTEALIALEKEKRERLDMESALSPRMFRD